MRQGDQGDPGERGPKGDHGQAGHDGTDGTDGTDGRTGPQGTHGLTGRSGGYALFVVTAIFVTLVFWGEDKRSCHRQALPRLGNQELAINVYRTHLTDAHKSEREHGKGNAEAVEDYRLAAVALDAANKNSPLDCSGLWPDDK